MELLVSGSEDELELSNQPDEDEEYISSPIHESTGQEEEEELVFLRCHGRCKREEEKEEMDEEQQVLCEGSCHLSTLGQYQCCTIISLGCAITFSNHNIVNLYVFFFVCLFCFES